MRITLDYHKTGLPVTVPDRNLTAILHMQPVTPLADPQHAVGQSLVQPYGCPPLVELAQGRKNACIVISDFTRPVPNKIILPPLLTTLVENGIPRQAITILVATGLHPPSEGELLREMVGDEILTNYRIVNHRGEDQASHVYLGKTPLGIPAYVDRTYVESDLKILTGLIEAHFMAGYSGGRKAIAPGLVSIETIKHFHGPAILEHPCATLGELDANPFHSESLAIARMAGADFIVNLSLDEQRRVTGVFSGELDGAHRQGARLVEQMITAEIAAPVDIVVTSAAGYPLDTTFYQAVKGMVGALDIVKPNGTVIIAAGCANGVGSPQFKRLLQETDDIDAFLEMIKQPGYFTLDQWEVEELCKVLRKAEVLMYTEGIPQSELAGYLVTPLDSVEQGIALALNKHGDQATLAVIPQGPYVMGRLKSHHYD